MENQNRIYEIHTERLIIRCPNPSDAEALKEAIDSSIPHLRPWMPWAHHEPTDITAKINLLRIFRSNFDSDKDYLYLIFEKESGRVLGGTGLHKRLGPVAREIGYWIRKDAEGKGYVTETVTALTRVALEVEGLQRVEIHCDPENRRSARVAENCGFTHEATLKQRTPADEQRYRDSMIFTLFQSEYQRKFPLAQRPQMQLFDAGGRPVALNVYT